MEIILETRLRPIPTAKRNRAFEYACDPIPDYWL
jgi:hypothetical protein